MLKHDKWISEKLGFAVYNLTSVTKLMESTNIHSELDKYEFIYCLTSTENVTTLNFLEQNGFRVVDTRVSFNKKGISSIEEFSDDILIMRHAEESDREEVCVIGGRDFLYTRFHLDPYIDNGAANEIKREWIENYFNGKRGDDLLIAEKEGQVAGFLSVIEKKDQNRAIIDLVCVSKDFQKQGVGRTLLSFFESEYKGYMLEVGTQVANIASMRCYVAAGFRPYETKYIVHRHRNIV